MGWTVAQGHTRVVGGAGGPIVRLLRRDTPPEPRLGTITPLGRSPIGNPDVDTRREGLSYRPFVRVLTGLAGSPDASGVV